MLAFYTGFRAPNIWSTNYYQTSWFDGFYRRAFLGTLLYPLGCLRFNYHVIETLQLGILAVVIALACHYSRKFNAAPIAIIYFFSASGGYLFHEAGYAEQIIWLVAAAAIYQLHTGRIAAASALLAVSILIHEISLLIALPLALAYMILNQRLRMRSLAQLFAAPAIAFALAFICFHRPSDSNIKDYMALAAQCGGALRRADYFWRIYHDGIAQFIQYHFTPAQLPYLITLVALSVFLSIGCALSFCSRILLSLCALSPLLLGLSEYDTDRWLFLAFTQIVTIRVMLLSRFPAAGRGYIFEAALVCAACFLRYIYFDGFAPMPLDYPHLQSFLSYLHDQLTGIPTV